ncbi:MAG: RNA polymerase sigma factor [Gemmatimonadota bacterium]
MLDESQAVELARRGDDSGWKLLYDRYVDLVFRLVMRVVGNHAAAMDVVQDTFVRAAAGIGGFRGEGSFRGWVARIAINEAHTAVRRRTRRREESLDDADPVDSAALPDERAERADLARRALEFARALPEKQREALLLRTTEGLSFAEIAAILDTSEGSARVSYHHALQKLRTHMSGLSEGARERPVRRGRHG